jgi:hypothetical protein
MAFEGTNRKDALAIRPTLEANGTAEKSTIFLILVENISFPNLMVRYCLKTSNCQIAAKPRPNQCPSATA